jgi:hypothetical protein
VFNHIGLLEGAGSVGTALPAAEEPLEGAEMDEMKARLEMLKS